RRWTGAISNVGLPGYVAMPGVSRTLTSMRRGLGIGGRFYRMIHGFMDFRRFAAGAVLCACASAVAFAQRPTKADQKAEAAAAQAQQQEYATVVRLADTAMSGQPTPSDFPIQFQNDFLRAQGGRVWVPITLTIDPAKLPSTAMTLYTRVAPRGTTAPPLPAP